VPTADRAYDAIVVAGGSARRLGGVDKPGLDVGGRTLLDRTLDAVGAAGRIVVVGPERASEHAVIWCREDPPGGGPVAAVAAGLDLVQADLVAVIAADLPRLAPAVPLLVTAATTAATTAAAGTTAALLVDPGGRVNHLAGVWQRATLTDAIGSLDEVVGASMRSLVAAVPVVLVPDEGGWGRDCDTWDDVRAARAEVHLA
jgi:molybdopterin-guanine dinucleotide biosynthesis protein A